jgi:hypothetical protein
VNTSAKSVACRLLLFGTVAIVLCIAGYFLLRAFDLFLVGPEQRNVLGHVPSPDGQYVAYTVAVNFGGATMDVSYEIVVHPGGRDFDPYKTHDWVWRCYKINPDKLFWQDSNTIRVPVDHSYKAYFGFIKTRSRHGITAVTDIT